MNSVAAVGCVEDGNGRDETLLEAHSLPVLLEWIPGTWILVLILRILAQGSEETLSQGGAALAVPPHM